MPRVLGIDLGTTNSAMAVMEAGEIQIVPNAEGERTTPSVVSYLEDGETLVGKAAKNRSLAFPRSTVSSSKRLMGRSFSDVVAERGLFPYRVAETANGKVVIGLKRIAVTPEQVAAEILSKLKADAEDYLGEPATHAVITVPAHFDSAQREATREAGSLAGFDAVELLDEPNASALAYGLAQDGTSSRIAVFDLGGGTFDVSVLELSITTMAVCALAGDNQLGGDWWDQALVDALAEEFLAEHGVELRSNPDTLRQLQVACENAKIALSSDMSAHIRLPFIARDEHGTPLAVDREVTRLEFEQMTRTLLARCRGPVEDALSRAGLGVEDIDEVVMVGGSTRMPMVTRLVQSLFHKQPHDSVNPDEVVALGAALRGETKFNGFKGSWLIDATALAPEIRAYAQGVVTTSGWWKEPW